MPIDPEDMSHIGVERSVCDERLDRLAPLEMWIDGDQRLGPKASAAIDCINLISEVLGADLGVGASEARVVRNKRAI